MKRIVEIVPARPGWYARWQVAPDTTRCHPVTVWALLEADDGTGREVIGVDCLGQWPDGEHHEADMRFVRYLFQSPETGGPDDLAPEHDNQPAAHAGQRPTPTSQAVPG